MGSAIVANRRYLGMLLLLCASCSIQGKSLDSLFESALSNFEFLPEYYTKFDLSTFAFHKNRYFKEQYLAESNTGLEFMFLSYRQILYSVWDVKFKIGLGDIPGNNVFSVLNIYFNIVPTIELRLPSVNIVAGYEHQCVHEVDRKNYPVIYYNAPFLAIGSKNMRVNEYWVPLAAEAGWKFKNRLGWYAAYVDYLKDGFGIVHPDKLNGYNAYSQEIRADGRYAFYRRKSWIFTVHQQLRLGHYDRTASVIDHGGIYWREDIGFESFFRRGKRGGALYCKYILDDLPTIKGTIADASGVRPDLPVFSKDKLLEIGVSFFN
jgi:hypothetical protein